MSVSFEILNNIYIIQILNIVSFANLGTSIVVFIFFFCIYWINLFAYCLFNTLTTGNWTFNASCLYLASFILYSFLSVNFMLNTDLIFLHFGARNLKNLSKLIAYKNNSIVKQFCLTTLPFFRTVLLVNKLTVIISSI